MFILYTLIVSVYFNGKTIYDSDAEYWDTTSSTLVDWGKVPNFIGVALFSFEAIGVVLSIRTSLRNPLKFYINHSWSSVWIP